MKNTEFLNQERDRLEQLIKNGIPSVYQSNEAYWYDFWSDLSWDMDERDAQIHLLLNDQDWLSLAEQVKEKTNLDFVQQVKSGIENGATGLPTPPASWDESARKVTQYLGSDEEGYEYWKVWTEVF